MINTIIQGDCLEVLKTIPENSIDSVITDPPYNLSTIKRFSAEDSGEKWCAKEGVFHRSSKGFMGKEWDNEIAFSPKVWQEIIRVLKPGGHLLSFGGTRTYHRMACAIEDAGFEVRDMIEWVYGSGFPKSLNIGKAVDKLQGNKREEQDITFPDGSKPRKTAGHFTVGENIPRDTKYTKGTSEWEGWGTALKPAHEPICMARKPLAEKTVAENCLKWGTDGINIDESRVGTADNLNGGAYSKGEYDTDGKVLELGLKRQEGKYKQPQGRFPANLIHDNSEEVRECFPQSSITGHRTQRSINNCIESRKINKGNSQCDVGGNIEKITEYTDSGSASRFFKSIIYIAKASKSERNMGCEELEKKEIDNQQNSKKKLQPNGKYVEAKHIPRQNNHPTVKPIALMEYLIRMITPKGGIVLDPFAGSGSTLIAAKKNGYKYIGIEKEKEYCEIAKARLKGITPSLL